MQLYLRIRSKINEEMKKVLLSCILLVYLSSCNKEYSEQFVAYNNNALNSDTAWMASAAARDGANIVVPALLAAPMIDSFDAVAGGEIRFPDNITITFPPHACMPMGSVTVSGKIKVELTYLKKKGDFIRYAKPTTSYDYLLQTGGSFNVGLSQNGNPILLAPGIAYKIKYRNTAPSNDMKFFYEELWLTSTDSSATWALGSGNQGNVNTWQQFDTASQSIIRGYEMTSTKQRWVNCDYFNDTSQPYTRMNVSLPINYTNANTSIYAVFKNKNIIAGLKSDFVSKTFYLPRIPINSEIILVSISKIGNDYYLGKKDITANNSNLISVSPEPKSLGDISNFLNGL